MVHIRARLLDHPPGQPRAANQQPNAATGPRSRPTGRRKSAGSADGGFRRWFESSNAQQYQNPPVFFDQDPEENEPAFSVSEFATDVSVTGFPAANICESEDVIVLHLVHNFCY